MTEEVSEWKRRDIAYQAHHAKCPQCISAGVTCSGQRCDEGAELWKAYNALPPDFLKQSRNMPLRTQRRS